MLAPDSLMNLAYRLDPVQMAKGAGLELDPWQSKLARSRALDQQTQRIS